MSSKFGIETISTGKLSFISMFVLFCSSCSQNLSEGHRNLNKCGSGEKYGVVKGRFLGKT